MTNPTDLTNGYGEPALRAAFEQVQDRSNWKNPIDAIIRDTAKAVVCEAIVFYTGSVPKVTELGGGMIRVQADGYYVAIGA